MYGGEAVILLELVGAVARLKYAQATRQEFLMAQVEESLDPIMFKNIVALGILVACYSDLCKHVVHMALPCWCCLQVIYKIQIKSFIFSICEKDFCLLKA